MRLGILGGSFDPVHYGHLLLAETGRDQGPLDRVWFLPAATPPHKRHRRMATGAQRMSMLEMATEDHPSFGVTQLELDRGGVSYTVDTVGEIHSRYPNAELFLLMGADSLADLPTWKHVGQICQLATPMVVCRAGGPDPDFDRLKEFLSPTRIATIRRQQVQMPEVGFSSSEIRRRVAARISIRYQTPPEVVEFIRQQGLYRDEDSA